MPCASTGGHHCRLRRSCIPATSPAATRHQHRGQFPSSSCTSWKTSLTSTGSATRGSGCWQRSLSALACASATQPGFRWIVWSATRRARSTCCCCSSAPTIPPCYAITRGGLCRYACTADTWKSRGTPPGCADRGTSQCAALATGTESSCWPTQTALNAVAGPSLSPAHPWPVGLFSPAAGRRAIRALGSNSVAAAATPTSPSQLHNGKGHKIRLHSTTRDHQWLIDHTFHISSTPSTLTR